MYNIIYTYFRKLVNFCLNKKFDILIPLVFKHGYSLETHLELWRKKSNTWAFVFFKKFQDNCDMHLDFKKWLQVFLLNGTFTDTEFYYFLLTNHDAIIVLSKNHNSRRRLSVFTISSQTKNKRLLQLQAIMETWLT